MARVNRYFLEGYVWHITHRCHRREFLLKFAKDRKRWLYWLFEARKRFALCVLNYMVTSNHIHLLVERYRVIDQAALMHLFDIHDPNALRRAHAEWVGEALKGEDSRRNESWSESLAVGRSLLAVFRQPWASKRITAKSSIRCVNRDASAMHAGGRDRADRGW